MRVQSLMPTLRANLVRLSASGCPQLHPGLGVTPHAVGDRHAPAPRAVLRLPTLIRALDKNKSAHFSPCPLNPGLPKDESSWTRMVVEAPGGASSSNPIGPGTKAAGLRLGRSDIDANRQPLLSL